MSAAAQNNRRPPPQQTAYDNRRPPQQTAYDNRRPPQQTTYDNRRPPQQTTHDNRRPPQQTAYDNRRPETAPQIRRHPQTPSTPSNRDSYVQKQKAKFEQTSTNLKADSKAKKQETKQKRKRLRNLYEEFWDELKQWKKDLKGSPMPVFDSKPEEIDRTEKIIQSLDELCKKFMGRFYGEFRQTPLMESSPGISSNEQTTNGVSHKAQDRRQFVSVATSTESQTSSETKRSPVEEPGRKDREIAMYHQKLEEMKKEHTEQMKAMSDRKEEIEKALKEKRDIITRMKDELSNRERRIAELAKNISTLKMEKEEALTRLSEIAGKKLHEDNANIADLSTDIRPTKISEKFRECYDNEWTDAFEELTGQEGYDEEKAILHLLKILKKTYEFSQMYSKDFETMLKRNILTFPNGMVENEVPGSISMDAEPIIKDLKKTTISVVVDRLQKKFVGDLNKALDSSLGNHMQQFATKCVELTWYMVIQTPPMEILADLEEGAEVDQDLFAYYTSQGKYVDFPVWPCVKLHTGGPLLSKGVVQGRKMKQREKIVYQEDSKVLSTVTNHTNSSLSNELSETLPVSSEDRETETFSSSSQTNRKMVSNKDMKSKTNMAKYGTDYQTAPSIDLDRMTRTVYPTAKQVSDSYGTGNKTAPSIDADRMTGTVQPAANQVSNGFPDSKPKASTVIAVSSPSTGTGYVNREDKARDERKDQNKETRRDEPDTKAPGPIISQETEIRREPSQSTSVTVGMTSGQPSTKTEFKTLSDQNSSTDVSQGMSGFPGENVNKTTTPINTSNLMKGVGNETLPAEAVFQKRRPAPSKPNPPAPRKAENIKSHLGITVAAAPSRGQPAFSKTIAPGRVTKKSDDSWIRTRAATDV